MKWIRELLSEKSELSTTRFVQVVGLFMAFGIALLGLKLGVDCVGLSILCLSFIIPQTIAKIMQKKIETKG
jgi:hypothetical protein